MWINVAAGIVLRQNKVFLALRRNTQHQGGLWEFPGGKCELGECPEDALRRELYEEIGITQLVMSIFHIVEHDYGDKKVRLHFFVVNDFQGEPYGVEKQQAAWFALEDLLSLDFPAANQVIVQQLLARFGMKAEGGQGGKG